MCSSWPPTAFLTTCETRLLLPFQAPAAAVLFCSQHTSQATTLMADGIGFLLGVGAGRLWAAPAVGHVLLAVACTLCPVIQPSQTVGKGQCPQA